MLETWLRESMVRLPTTVILETWPRESGDHSLRNFFDKPIYFVVSNYHASLVNTDNPLIVYQISTPPVMLEN